jgi:hypothetical protein
MFKLAAAGYAPTTPEILARKSGSALRSVDSAQTASLLELSLRRYRRATVFLANGGTHFMPTRRTASAR